jgi:hypothetical protein
MQIEEAEESLFEIICAAQTMKNMMQDLLDLA